MRFGGRSANQPGIAGLLCAHCFFQKLSGQGGVFLPGKRSGRSHGVFSYCLPQSGILTELSQQTRQRGHILRISEDKTVHAIAKESADPCLTAGHCGQTACHRLQHGQCEGIEKGRTSIGVRSRVKLQDVTGWTFKAYSRGHAEPSGTLGERCSIVASHTKQFDWEICARSCCLQERCETLVAPIIPAQQYHKVGVDKPKPLARGESPRLSRLRSENGRINAVGYHAHVLSAKLPFELTRCSRRDSGKRQLGSCVDPLFESREEAVIHRLMEPSRPVPQRVALFAVFRPGSQGQSMKKG